LLNPWPDYACGGWCETDKLPVTGTYTVVVYDAGSDATGEYSITLQGVSATFNGQPSCGEPIACGQTLVREIDGPGPSEVAVSVGERAVRNWVHRYNESGVDGLRDARTGRRCQLSAEDQARLKERIRAGPRAADAVCSLRGEDVRQILKDEFGVEYGLPGVYYLLHHQLGFSYLKPRPIHRKADPQVQEAFKKISPKRSPKSAKNIRTSGSRSGSRTKAASDNKGR
jgi:transposase